MKPCALMVFAAVLIFATSVQAGEWHENLGQNLYVSGALGITRINDPAYTLSDTTGKIEIDDAVNIAGALGSRVTDTMRMEAEMSYRNANPKQIISGGVHSLTGELETLAVLVNGYYDFMAGKTLRPYVSGGLGFARHNVDFTNYVGRRTSGSDIVPVWQFGAGVSYGVTEKTSLFGGGRYLASNDIKFGPQKFGYDAYEFMVGMRYGF